MRGTEASLRLSPNSAFSPFSTGGRSGLYRITADSNFTSPCDGLQGHRHGPPMRICFRSGHSPRVRRAAVWYDKGSFRRQVSVVADALYCVEAFQAGQTTRRPPQWFHKLTWSQPQS
jgi:hypothetical protein